MEYIVVRLTGLPFYSADVLLDGEINGKTGELLTLGNPGWVLISVNVSGAIEQSVEVKNTSPTRPMEIDIESM
ncbi:MAG: hypothetical protein ABJB69_05130 [Spartobacteria bacterium]